MCFHKWDKWKEYKQPYTLTPNPGFFGYVENKVLYGIDYRQKRSCLKCGKVQDILIRS